MDFGKSVTQLWHPPNILPHGCNWPKNKLIRLNGYPKPYPMMAHTPYASLRYRLTELRRQLIHWSLKNQGVEPPNLQGVSCRTRFECAMTFPTMCLKPERSMGSRLQSTIGCFPELCFLQFSVGQGHVWLRMQFINNFVFHIWACAAGFNRNRMAGFKSRASALLLA